MEKYDRSTQSGDLTGAIERGRKHRVVPKRRAAKAALIGAVLIAGGGIALANCHGSVPPHEERIGYFVQNHRDSFFNMKYSPDFEESSMWVFPQGSISLAVGTLGERGKKVIRILDGMDSNRDEDAERREPADGTMDYVMAQKPDGSSCLILAQGLPKDMQEQFAEHYDNSSEGFYRHVQDGKDKYKSNIGEEEFERFFNRCMGRGIYTEAPEESDVPSHRERIDYLMDKLDDNEILELKYKPFFHIGGPVNLGDGDFGALVMHIDTAGAVRIVMGADEAPADGTTDLVLLTQVNRRGPRTCTLSSSDIPSSLLDKIEDNYHRTTEAGYLFYEEYKTSFRGALGKDEWNELATICNRRRKSVDLDSDIFEILQLTDE